MFPVVGHFDRPLQSAPTMFQPFLRPCSILWRFYVGAENSKIPIPKIRYHPFGIGIGTDIAFGISVPESTAGSTEIPKYRISFGIPSSAVTAWGGGGVFRPPRFFWNNSWTLADIDMKLGMPLRTSILRRSVKKNPIRAKKLRYSRFCDVTSCDFGAKKINVWKFIKNTFVKRIARKLHEYRTWTVLRDGYLGFLKFWFCDL